MSCEAAARPVALPFQVGARTLARVTRPLVTYAVSLEEAMSGAAPNLPQLGPSAEGYFLRALPADLVSQVAQATALRPFIRQAYPRHYARLDQPFERHLDGFSAKSRSGLKRKVRKLAERSGGTLDLRLYRTAPEMAAFHAGARAVSALTYQERLLDAGMPADALPELERLAAADAVRCWLLFVDDRPVSYLHAPARGDCLLYAHLGYDPAFADLSPGTVMQLEAMRMLMDEWRFRWFDFTEGDGQHKRQFASGAVDSVDLLLLRPSMANLAAVGALSGFDGGVALAKRWAGRLGLDGVARAVRR